MLSERCTSQFVGDCGNAFLNTLQSVFERKTDYGNKAGECNCHGLCRRDAKSYIDYAMSVIISRALPDVRDGLKPVQRRTCMICTSLGFVTTVHIVSAPVSLEIPWVNTTSRGQLYL